MDLNWLLFSHEGRLNRQPYLMVSIALFVLNILMGIGLLLIGTDPILRHLFSILMMLLALMPCIKRLHDRNRSGWFLLLGLIPVLNIWVLVELFILKGTVGDNKYGVDPLAEDGVEG